MNRPRITKVPTETTIVITLRDRDAKTIGALAKRHRLDEGELLLAALAFLIDPEKAKALEPEMEKDEFKAFVEAQRDSVVEFED